MKISKLLFVLAICLVFCKCSSGDGPGSGRDLYVRVSVNGTEDLNVMGKIGGFDPHPIMSSVTVTDNGGLKANTVQISAVEIDEETSTVIKTLSITLQGITTSGTYDMVEKEGMFLYTTPTGDIADDRYYISLEEHGTCTITIEEIGSDTRPGIGKPIKGTFSATVVIDGDGNTHTLTGEFNGGV